MKIMPITIKHQSTAFKKNHSLDEITIENTNDLDKIKRPNLSQLNEEEAKRNWLVFQRNTEILEEANRRQTVLRKHFKKKELSESVYLRECFKVMEWENKLLGTGKSFDPEEFDKRIEKLTKTARLIQNFKKLFKSLRSKL